MKTPSHIHMPKASVIITTWNGLEWLKPCIQSLQEQSYTHFDILVVDNASTDRTTEWIQQQQRKNHNLHLIRSSKNRYFGGGNNLGALAAKQHNSQLLLFLNNDAIAGPDWVETMLSAFSRFTEYGILASTTYDIGSTDTIQTTGTKIKPSGTIAPIKDPIKTAVQEQEAISGEAFGIRTALFFKLNGFDESYQMYFEDTDLCLRARKFGTKIGTLRDAKVWHKKSATTNTASEKKVIWSWESHMRFAQRHLSKKTATQLRQKLQKEAFKDLFRTTPNRKKTTLYKALRSPRISMPFTSQLQTDTEPSSISSNQLHQAH